MHNNDQQFALWVVFCCLRLVWALFWLCRVPQAVKAADFSLIRKII